MGAEAPKPASTSTGAVFLSYASQDAEAARRICEALRASDIEVWFDQSELRGGDSWDRKIRDQIHDCHLFIPLISANTECRDEGYFRREWALAADRTRDMAHKRTFIVPVVVDGTSERGASVPEKFFELQWTRLPAGESPPAFVERMKRLLTREESSFTKVVAPGLASGSLSALLVRQPSWPKSAVWSAGVIVTLGCAYFIADKVWLSKRSISPVPTAAPVAQPAALIVPTAAAFVPPPHSIAVLPFVNMSGDKDQEYFSDGLTEELLNSLARIKELQVAARTSAFSFKGKDTDIGTIARKLNVGAILEGSVRRAGQTVRVTAQLNNAVSGFHLWSQTYDRDTSNILQLQTEIANAVADALKVTILGDVSDKIKTGGTHIPAAFDAYLRASTRYGLQQSATEHQAAIDAYTEAIRLDPEYALAYADRSVALAEFALYWASGSAVHNALAKAEVDARKAVDLAPELAEGHLALAALRARSLDFTGADQEYRRAITLAPGAARIVAAYGDFSGDMGKYGAALSTMERAVALDPLNPEYYIGLGDALHIANREDDARRAYNNAKTLAQNNALQRAQINTWIALTYYAEGNFQQALAACEDSDDINRPICLALVYDKLARHADAETMLAKIRASSGGDGAVFYSMVYAQWGETAQALHWLEVAMQRKDPFLKFVKANALFDPLRKVPRYLAIERALRFPN
jgi:TolB-like protein/Flp pilus assembly protein TadD